MMTIFMTDLKIYGFSGKMGVGKNFLAEKVFAPMLNDQNYMILSFANHFKIEEIVKSDLDRKKVFGKKDLKTRKTLQKRGTEEGRDKHGKDHWIKIVNEWIEYYYTLGIRTFIITDTRFINEVEYIKNRNGFVIRVQADDRNLKRLQEEAVELGIDIEDIKNHSSETELDNYNDFDYILNNSEENYNIFNEVRNLVREVEDKVIYKNIFFIDLDDTICSCKIYYHNQALKLLEKCKQCFYNFKEEDFWNVYNEYNKNFETEYYDIDKFSKSLVEVVIELNRKYNLQINNTILLYLYICAEEIGKEVFDHNYEAFEGAVETVRELQKYGKVVITTLGDFKEQNKKLSYLGLTDLEKEVTLQKNEFFYRRCVEKHKGISYYMIGDSLKNDIEPSLKLNFTKSFWIGGNKDLKNVINLKSISEINFEEFKND